MMHLHSQTSRDLLSELARLKAEVRATATYVAREDGTPRLNPELAGLVQKQVAIIRVLRRRRARVRHHAIPSVEDARVR